VEFTWDERKNRVNKRKHRISFDTAISVFNDPFHVSRQDREVENEERWQTIGMVRGVRVLLVAHTVEENDGLIRHEKRRRERDTSMRKATKNVRTGRSPGRALTRRQKKELAALAALPDNQIDTSDIPELPASAWKDAIRGRFYRPVKQAVSMRLDADVIAWLRKAGSGYQTRANRILRERMLAEVMRTES
jgi:uncharacterized protein (DUF4415 family)